MAREVGDKLGPRLSKLFLSHNLALRTQLAPIESKIAAAATQIVIDKAGEEIAGLWRPFTSKLLAYHGDSLPPELAHLFTRMESGLHQWEAISGNLQMASTSALSSVLSNYLFPITGPLNQLAPSVPVDAQTGAAAVAAGLAGYDAGVGTAAAWGNTSDAFAIMYKLAQQIPGVTQLFDLMNRGVLQEATVREFMQRGGLPPELADSMLYLAGQLIMPADAALAVLRGNITAAQGYDYARATGLADGDFDVIVANTGEPPALEEMLMLRRRNLITDELLDRAILQSRVRDEWIPYVKLLSVEPPSAADVLNALVQGQVSQAEAELRFAQAGGDPTWFQVAYDSTANSPAPVELAELANRGIIPWDGLGPDAVTWEQGFREGRWKDKWQDAYRQLAVYHPPPREISTLVKEGGISQDEAMQLWQEAGLSPELAHVYWVAAHYNKTSSVHTLAQAEITKLYTDRAITRDEAKSMLETVNWTATDAEWLLDIADLSVERAALEAAISKIKGLYVAWKITDQQASAALHALDVVASQVTSLMAIWSLERTSNVKVLTSAEITDAYYYQIVDVATAQAELQNIGYTAHDAWLLLNIKNKALIPDYPDPGQ
jgi:hypothetical protein